MSPLPCSPVSNSTASESYSIPNTSEEDSDVSLTTPRAGPADPALRTNASLSRPSVPTFSSSPENHSKASPTAQGNTDADSTGTSPLRVDTGAGPGLNRSSSSSNTGNRFAESAGSEPSRKGSIRFQPRESSPRRKALFTSQISTNMSRASPAISPYGGSPRREDEHEIAESSADENTAIFRRENAATRVYGAVGTSDATGQDDANTSRRRLNFGRGKDAQASSSGNTEARSPSAPEESGKSAEGERWWKGFAEKYGSIELENKGSVARDHLALERTFLAWLRTSLSFASIGIAITQLFRLNTTLSQGDGDSSSPGDKSGPAAHLKQVGKPLGATFLGISILILLLGFNRYFEGQHYVIRGKFPASRATIVLVSMVAGALIVASLAVVLAVAPGAFET